MQSSTPKTKAGLPEKEMVVVAYKPQEFNLALSRTALEFVDLQGRHSSSFEINPLVAEQTGISKFKEDQITAEVEQKTLELMQDLQERAYQEGYQLGLEQGTEKAFIEKKSELDDRLDSIDALLRQLTQLRTQLMHDHEGEVVRLVFDIAKKIIFREIQEDPTVVKDLLIALIEGMDVDGRINVRLSANDFKFVEELKQRGDKKLIQLERINLEQDDQIQSGGCLIETNYGSIDATIEQRLQRAWELILKKRPSSAEAANLIQHNKNEGDES